MTPFDAFLRALDRLWIPRSSDPKERIPLRVIGSVALMLQVNYVRGTKDGDILESLSLPIDVQVRLKALGGKGTMLATHHNIYLDIVPAAIPFLPRAPIFHPVEHLNRLLTHFHVEALDITDVVVSKLKPFRPNDLFDIEQMAARGHLDPEYVASRFKAALDAHSMSAISDEFPQYARNLNQIERDYFFTDETPFEFDE